MFGLSLDNKNSSKLTENPALANLLKEKNTLFSVPTHPRNRTSDVFLLLVERTYEGKITLSNLTERFGDRTFGILLLLLAAFNVIPFVSLISGLLVSVLGFQMFFGMKRARLPKAILNWKLPPERVRKALLVFEPKIRSIEKFIRPRWQFAEAPVVDRINGLLIAILGLIIAFPIPFTNVGPALVIVIMSLGLLERDGLVQCVALVLGLVSIALVYSLLITASTFGP